MKSRAIILSLVGIVLVALTMFSLPYNKIGSLNPVWAQSYLGNADVQSTCTNLTGPACSYQTGWGYATFTGGCNYLVYRMGPDGVLYLDTDVLCVNNQLRFFVTGTGHYFFYPARTGSPHHQSVQWTLPINFEP
jgi:hypothetical protein